MPQCHESLCVRVALNTVQCEKRFLWILRISSETEERGTKMASKLRNRTPLFGYDGNLGIPIIPSSSSSSAASRASKGSPYQVSV